ncbi:MAG: hypothetical protein KF813_06750 [Trueperaceae bacterium]|nr:hypothetical protein [Trueperaceae bacterium]
MHSSTRRFTKTLHSLLALLAAAVIVVGCGGTTPPDPDEPNLFLLVPDYTLVSIDVLSAVDDTSELARNSSASFGIEDDASTTGAAFGPGDRIYVADHGVGRILVYDVEEAFEEASPEPVAIITSASFEEPVSIAFDTDGNLWVSDGRRSSSDDPVPNHILRFDAVDSVVGDSVLTPDAVIELHLNTSLAFNHNQIRSLYFDHLGRLWFVDYHSWTVFRIDDPGDFTGTTSDVVPDFQFRALDAGDANASPIRNPSAVLLSASGVLYVGNDGQNTVARFDDLSEIGSGLSNNVPSANLSVGLQRTNILAFDPNGDLWVGSSGDGTNSQLVRITDPTTGTGAVTKTPAQTVNWAPGSQFTYGGSLLFQVR